ncbi:MAG: hypothetical protein GY869_15555 [Planctomycetes bacterium]|nr:hypothetical protein [Planctomycetota bacterium]
MNDRPLAYQLKTEIEGQFSQRLWNPSIIVLSDLWYLHSEPLHKYPMISIGSPRVNAVSANLVDILPPVLAVEQKLQIQLDLLWHDLRAIVWGNNRQFTIDALQIFAARNYLDRFLDAAMARSS